MDYEIEVSSAAKCPLRFSDESAQYCVLKKIRCEEYNDAFPTECPILDETFIIKRKRSYHE